MTKPGSLRNTAKPGYARRMPAALLKETDRRLLAYALAGAGAVTLSPSADAEIVYTPAEIKLTQGVLHIDLNHDDTNDFALHNIEFNESGSSNYPHGDLQVTPDGNKIVAVLGLQRYRQAFAVRSGFPIGPDSPKPFVALPSRGLEMAYAFCYPLKAVQDCNSGGYWKDVTARYLGVRFEINGEVHYGWARFSVAVSQGYIPLIKAKLTGYAYETEPNKTILAGDRGLGPEASTGDGHPLDANLTTDRIQQFLTLGQLSLGSIGLDAWRQHKQNFGGCVRNQRKTLK